MMQQGSFIENLKYQWKYGGMHIKLIGVNIAIFLVIRILLLIGSFITPHGAENFMFHILNYVFALHGTLIGLLTHPWGIITSIFAHYAFWHLAFNMIFLYFIAQLFLRYFSNNRMLYTYILGGIAGGLLQIVAYYIIPPSLHAGGAVYVIGASGAINAIFMAAAFYRPKEQVYLFGMIRIRMIYLALGFILLDLLQMSGGSHVAHFAHLGGAAFGYLSIYNINSRKNIINLAEKWGNSFIAIIKGNKKPKMKVKKGKKYTSSTKEAQFQTDEEYNANKKKKQEAIDKILDKISKSGYDSLTKKEKQILFEQSNK